MLQLYNSLSRKIEEFVPLHTPKVHLYCCGPTVYNFAHIGNFRTYAMVDILYRTFQYNGLDVTYVMNLTDVGHLTGDNLGDADTGEDRMEKAAKKEGKTAWDIAEFYTEAFIADFDLLHLQRPLQFAKATEHIKEQIELIQDLEAKGYTYQTSDGIYFNTARFKDYGKLSDMDQIKEGARVEINPEKLNARDFALWKFSTTDEKRQMEWDSPWGVGFPGWHIECSAMSMKYLGKTLDIHAGGIDLKQTHHPNEIAQSEAATGKKFVNYWMHVAFVLVQGERMSKSLGNNYRLYDLIKEDYDPIALRYLYLQTHYRQEMNFTFPALDGAQNALKRLRLEIASWDEPEDQPAGSGVEEYENKFLEALNDDLNTPKALSAMWELVKSDLPTSAKAAALFQMDTVLGLDLREGSLALAKEMLVIPDEVKLLVKEREHYRKNRQFSLADNVRAKITRLGYMVEDSKTGPKINKK